MMNPLTMAIVAKGYRLKRVYKAYGYCQHPGYYRDREAFSNDATLSRMRSESYLLRLGGSTLGCIEKLLQQPEE